MGENIPSFRIEEKDVDRVIATFGAKPEPEKKQEITSMLEAQKAKFLEQERTKSQERGR